MKDGFDLKEELKKLPDRPGVYLMHAASDEIIYVGKAINLKRRVSSYFRAKVNRGPKIDKMISLIDYFEYIVTDSELEALVLENTLIKEHSPKYNTMLKDDKSYPFMKVTVQEDFPRVLFARQMKRDGAKYFGPYTSAGAVKDTIELVKKLYGIRTCNKSLPKEIGVGRPCLYHQMGQCAAPCQGYISKEEYALRIDNLLGFLNGDYKKVIRDLEAKMKEKASNYEFEEAAQYRDLIESVQHVTGSQRVVKTGGIDRDVIAMARKDSEIVVSVFFVRDGKLLGREHFHMNYGVENTSADTETMPDASAETQSNTENKSQKVIDSEVQSDIGAQLQAVGREDTRQEAGREDTQQATGAEDTRQEAGREDTQQATGAADTQSEEAAEEANNKIGSQIMEAFIKQYYNGTPFVPNELLIEYEVGEQQLIEEWLSKLRGGRVHIIVPQKGEKHKMIDLARENASVVLSRDLEKLKREEARTVGAAKELADMLGLPSADRLEAFDISNTSGYQSVASMVVFEKGRARKNAYRKFKLRTVTGPDDYKSMEEVLTRRFTDERFDVMPDILMMDGGRGQVNVALRVLEELNLNIPVCGMVKDDNHRTRGLYFNNKEISFPRNSEVFGMITRLQDEAHRFAITYHKNLRGKEQVHSILDDIKGVGPARRKALMQHFKEISKIKEASVEELSEVKGITPDVAGDIYKFFHEED
ncbi:MAG: excinuclease ABC subunit C [Lachnospiraceae bacterium]|nr:excinuclease ABC subunit C [Lachnospiraceae bacterium]